MNPSQANIRKLEAGELEVTIDPHITDVTIADVKMKGKTYFVMDPINSYNGTLMVKLANGKTVVGVVSDGTFRIDTVYKQVGNAEGGARRTRRRKSTKRRKTRGRR